MAARTETLSTPQGLVTIAAAPDVGWWARRAEGKHRQFIADHWSGLAAAAWAGFQRHGAGAVVLTVPEERGQGIERATLFFATQIHNLPGMTEADFSGWEARQIEEYDPQSEVVVVVLVKGRVHGYRATGPVEPTAAFRGNQASLN